jgi:SecD/SecF fusion protein
MLHDVTVVLGIFAALHGILPFNMDVDQAFIAAILTVIGYSINDTVIVFDRIRENLNLHKSTEEKEQINSSLNSTLSRTINTSMTTFIVLLIIFIFGGAAIKGFIFALMIGVLVGTYSSVCIATPVLIDFSKRVRVSQKND